MNPQNKLTTEQFVAKAKAIHGDKFDYSKTTYVNGETKVRIVCPIHGESLILPRQHLIGFGCRKCGYDARKKKQPNSTESFVEAAKAVYGDKYDYSKTFYIGRKKKVSFICPEHGEVSVIAGNHLRGHGCPKCGIARRAKLNLSTTESFVKRATEVHHGKYNYSKSVYKGLKGKIYIICPEHGGFWQNAGNHLNGVECPRCGYLRTKNKVNGLGVNDVDYIAKSKCYRKWKSILERTSPSYRYKAYENVSICEEWLIFSNFKQWFDENYIEGFAIDKDLLSPCDNKIYSPQTCCFLPRIINNVIKEYPTDKPIGIRPSGYGRYRVKLSAYAKQTIVGYYDSFEEAQLAYKSAKKQYVNELAEKYFKEGKINERVYNALLKFEVTD